MDEYLNQNNNFKSSENAKYLKFGKVQTNYETGNLPDSKRQVSS